MDPSDVPPTERSHESGEPKPQQPETPIASTTPSPPQPPLPQGSPGATPPWLRPGREAPAVGAVSNFGAKLLVASEPPPPLEFREPIALLGMLVLCDVAIYAGGGYAGYALFLALAPVILLCGSLVRHFDRFVLLLGGLLLLLGWRLIWLGSVGGVLIGFAVLSCFIAALAGLRPFLLEVFIYSSICAMRGIPNTRHYFKVKRYGLLGKEFKGLEIFAPLAALIVFGGIFLLANPDLQETVSGWLHDFLQWLRSFHITFNRVLFWGLVLVLTAGAMRTSAKMLPALMGKKGEEDSPKADRFGALADIEFSAARNTLFTVIILFCVYLVYEFAKLWVRPIPGGFAYSAYAHHGAAWLTVALAVATFTLGIIFHPKVAAHDRIAHLRNLAAIWSVENFVLAVCAFHRTQIYVHYNGLSRMRVVALFGIAVVVAGFVLVLVKVVREKNLLWLVRRELWALGITLYLLVLTPIDLIVTHYNVGRIMGGDPAPIVQITVHPIGPDAIPALLPLANSSNEVVREGIRAHLAQSALELEGKAEALDYKSLGHSSRSSLLETRGRSWAKQGDWSDYQIAPNKTREILNRHKDNWVEYLSDSERYKAQDQLKEYAMQWYH